MVKEKKEMKMKEVEKMKMKMKEVKRLGVRKATVFKKAKELSVLCDVDLLIIMYPDAHPLSQPQLWCSKPDAASQIISRYLTYNNSQLPNSNSNSKKLTGIMSKFDNNNNGFLHNLGIHDLNSLLAHALPAKIDHVKHIINSIKNFGVNSINQPPMYEFPDIIPCDNTHKPPLGLGCPNCLVSCACNNHMDGVDWFNLGDLGLFGDQQQQGTLETLVGINSSSCSDMNAAHSFCQSPTDEYGVDSTCFDKNDVQSLRGDHECGLMNFGDTKDDDYQGLLGFDDNAESGMETADDLHNLLMQFEVDDFGKDEQVMGFQGFNAAAAHHSIAV